MKAIIFGATGMVGQGVLRECLLDPEVESVLTVGRTQTGQQHPKLQEIAHKDFSDFSASAQSLTGYDACFWCLGVTSAGMSEQEYKRMTYDFTVAAAKVLAKQSPGMTFIFISGTGADSTEKGRTMWARVKGKAENEILRMPFKAAYVFRPAYIQPLNGIQSRTKLYRTLYAVIAPLYPLIKLLLPGYVTTTEQLGRAMIKVAKNGATKHVIESSDIARII
jgi:uncharacterized protein YbjT (DUF2867 family)